ncbi:hypothetical protein AKO1_005835, partial [Acrasis kona]
MELKLHHFPSLQHLIYFQNQHIPLQFVHHHPLLHLVVMVLLHSPCKQPFHYNYAIYQKRVLNFYHLSIHSPIVVIVDNSNQSIQLMKYFVKWHVQCNW